MLFTSEFWLFVPILSAVGIVAGLLAGLLGVGGGIVVVPALFFSFLSIGISPEDAMLIATGTSLATIIPTSVSSVRSHAKMGNIDFELIKHWGIFIGFGAFFGGFIISYIGGHFLRTLFAIIAVMVSINIFFNPFKNQLIKKEVHLTIQRSVAWSIGFFSVMVGIGGGTLGVPSLTILNHPIRKAIGTSAVFGLIIALCGVCVLLIKGDTPSSAITGTFSIIYFPALLFIVPLSVIFAAIGVRLNYRLDSNKLKKVFAIILLLTGFRMLVQ